MYCGVLSLVPRFTKPKCRVLLGLAVAFEPEQCLYLSCRGIVSTVLCTQ